jgi:hypothetical protein
MIPFVCSVSGIALVAREVLRSDPRARDPRLGALVAVLFFQTMMTFQIFPRGSFNAALLMGTLGPISAHLLYRWHALVGTRAPNLRPARSAAALVLVAIVPMLFVGDLVRYTLRQPRPAELAATALHFAALDGVRVTPDEYERQDLGAFEELIDRLRSIKPPDAPIFTVSNEAMIYLLSERTSLFEDHAYLLFLTGWDMLAADAPDGPTSSQMIDRLERTSDAVVVVRLGDVSVRNFARLHPEVMAHLRESYRLAFQVGDYRVLRRARVPTASAGP